MSTLIFRRGLDLKAEVAGALSRDYHSGIVEQIRESDYRYRAGDLTIHLAREFGFCYGVERAVDYAYQTRRRFPDRSVYLTGEIIHNPHVNNKLRAVGIRFLSDPGEDWSTLGDNDVVILPAFGLPVSQAQQLGHQGCVQVDTTCGSVLNVWKAVTRYARDGFTAIIHGKVHHEETKATASQALTYPNGHYLIVLDCDEAAAVCRFITSGEGSSALLERFAAAASPGFDPNLHLARIGLANQTTMLMSESLQVEERFRAAMRERYGDEALAEHFRAFDTICSATQDRQDAVVELVDGETLDLMIVIGGYNSSNTRNLARICGDRLPTYHIEDATCLLSNRAISHRPNGAAATAPSDGAELLTTTDWLPSGQLNVGLTAGASTPNNIVGETVERLTELATR